MKLYICVLDEFPDHMTPTLVGHAVLGAHLHFSRNYILDQETFADYVTWLEHSFKKCVVRVNRKEFDRILDLEHVYRAHEIHTLEGRTSCAVPLPCDNDKLPNVLKFAKLWSPNYVG
jgi:hypothetical protein